MRHLHKGRKLNRTSAHRLRLLANLAQSLTKHEQIKTTLPKAKELKIYFDKLITVAKKGTLHARRQLIAKIGCEKQADKLLTVLATRYRDRHGGYTRVMRYGFRYGDTAPMAIIELVDRDIFAKGQDSGPVVQNNVEQIDQVPNQEGN